MSTEHSTLSPVGIIKTVTLQGLPLACISATQLVDHVFESLSRGQGGWIITANIDHLQRYVSTPDIVDLYSHAEVIVADGTPLVWASRLLGDPLPERIAGSDLVWTLAEHAAEKGRSICLLGGAPGAAEGAAKQLLERFPNLVIAATCSPTVSEQPTEDEVEAIRKTLQAASPDIVYVAIGSPKQERLIAALRSSLPATWWIGVGVSLSFVAGHVSRAPRWVQRLGLEWVHRMLQEPERLVKRYLFNNLPFTFRLFARSLVTRFTSAGSR
ncbi:N-acetylglucosaminyldiphosphoundecaprenol N-acetyl-beta-D-mannosaminyltransferase [Thiogranum longum]|uniref:N-acetylglucosaminyldiphosphoundecaprenol N-acetyl-beta-D-mannosaminyltransferase n=1 Tax=Thiogranum longum TaxID=1537524 RepID=A0A4R1H8L0_9GAMM|nr:WecB/TagA/CpsF family glycosyltransferase [Thiogranum longum]TCK18174.1 N-acetylglucosaminyldiphosphoundecaprenol N-acetyl-beta-D-mannosaminyltransferase [Thiogranum longum]